MNSPPEPVSPSPSTPSSGSPPPEDNDMALDQQGTGSITLVTPSSSQGGGQLPSPSLTKRRLLSGPSHNRDSKTRKRDDGGSKRYGGSIAEVGRDGRKDEFVDSEFMDRLKAEFGDPFDDTPRTQPPQ